MKKTVLISIWLLFVSPVCLLFAQEINWLKIQDLEAAQKEAPKKVLIDIYTDWCGWCKRLDATTFKDPKIVDYLNKNYYCVKLDGENKNTITYRGVEFKFVPTGRRGYHQLSSGFQKGRHSYPTLTVLDENLDILQIFRGYKKAEDLLPILVYLSDDLYKKQDWDSFLSEFKKSN